MKDFKTGGLVEGDSLTIIDLQASGEVNAPLSVLERYLNKKQKQQKIECRTKNAETMYAIKIIQTHNKDQRQLTELISGSEVKYEFGTYKNSEEYGKETLRLLGDHNHYQYHGHARIKETDDATEIHKGEQKIDGPKQFIVLSVFSGNEWNFHIIEDSWVFIMLNGKTIDKLLAIN